MRRSTKKIIEKLQVRAWQMLFLFCVVGGAYLTLQIVIGLVHYTMNADEIAAQYTPQYMKVVERGYNVE